MSNEARDSISRDDARDRIGRAFYGESFVDLISDDDWVLIQFYGPDTPLGLRKGEREIVGPCPDHLFSATCSALGRFQIMAAQGRTVDEWLELYGFDCQQPSFDRAAFEAALEGPLGQAITEVRKQLLVANDQEDAPAVGEAMKAAAHRRGPAPGTIDRYGKSDRALFPAIDAMIDRVGSAYAAALELAQAGRVDGVGTAESRAKRLSGLYLAETR